MWLERTRWKSPVFTGANGTLYGETNMMKYVHSLVGRIHSKDEGVTALEYALIAALIAAAIVGVVTTTGTDVGNTFTRINNALP